MNGLGAALGRLTVGTRHCAPVMKGILIESWELKQTATDQGKLAASGPYGPSGCSWPGTV